MDSSIGIGDLAAIVTLTGVTIYVLGLVGLAIPIFRTFTGDLATAWYAVSLLPRTVVAGQGVRIWVQWPLFMTAILLLTTWLLPGLTVESVRSARVLATELLLLTAGVSIVLGAFTDWFARHQWHEG